MGIKTAYLVCASDMRPFPAIIIAKLPNDPSSTIHLILPTATDMTGFQWSSCLMIGILYRGNVHGNMLNVYIHILYALKPMGAVIIITR